MLSDMQYSAVAEYLSVELVNINHGHMIGDAGISSYLSDANPDPIPEVDFRKLPDLDEAKRLDGGHNTEFYEDRKRWMRDYASHCEEKNYGHTRILRKVLGHSREYMERAINRQLYQTFKTGNMQDIHEYYTSTANINDVMRGGVNVIAKNVLAKSVGKREFDDDVIDKILRYVNPTMNMPGIPQNCNGDIDCSEHSMETAFQLASLGSRERWESRQKMHPRDRQPYHPLLPFRPYTISAVWTLESDFKSLQDIEMGGMRDVYSTMSLVQMIKGYIND